MPELLDPTTKPDSLSSAPQFRINGKLHDVLMESSPGASPGLPAPKAAAGNVLPVPVYPQRTYSDEDDRTLLEYQRLNARRVWNSWGKPYFASRSLKNRKELRPIIAYLFTDYKCNLDCHYCWAYNNAVKGMTEETAKRSIDWLESMGNRVLALMGGEPLLRPDFVHKVTDYATKKGFFVYLPTNGRLMRPEVIDRLGDAGLATVNIAIDSIDVKPSLPKALAPIRAHFDYLLKRQRRYGYTVAINTNICRNNMDDVRMLTELALERNISIDFHINEAPMISQGHFQHYEENETYLRPQDYGKVDDLLDWIIERHKGGQRVVNPLSHLRGDEEPDAGRGEDPMELPGRTQHAHHPRRRHARALLSHVLREPRLGDGGKPQIRGPAARRDEEGVHQALPFDLQLHSRLLLQHAPRRLLGHEAGDARLQGRERELLAGQNRTQRRRGAKTQRQETERFPSLRHCFIAPLRSHPLE